MLRIIKLQALLLAASLLLILVSCKNETGATEPDDSTAGGTPADTSEIPLEIKDFGGKDVNILIRAEWNYEYNIAEENGEIISDAIFRRNAAIEERYNCDFNFIERKGDWANHTDFTNHIHSSVLAGDNTYDFIAGYQYALVTNIQMGDFMNLLRLPYIDFEADWWIKEGISALTINDRCYMICGDIGISTLEGIYCMFFNKRIAAENKIEDLYEVVRTNKWTHEKFMNIIMDTSADINGDTRMDENDRYGFVAVDVGIRPYIVCYDTPTLSFASDGKLECIWNSEHTSDVIESLIAMAYDKDVLLLNENGIENNMFMSGQSMIIPSRLGNSAIFRDMDDDFGIIPYPMYSEEQRRYLTTTANSISMICIPITAATPDDSALLIEAMCREAHELITPAYYEIALKGKYARDEESLEMIELIRGNLTFDRGWINSLVTNISGLQYSKMVKSKNTNFSSWYAGQESVIRASIGKLEEFYYQDE